MTLGHDRDARITTRILVGAAALTIFAGEITSNPASADTSPSPASHTDRADNGNGHHNHNILSLRSPTYNRGYQHTSTTTAGGATNIQNAMCRNVKACTINLNVPPPRTGYPVTPQAPPVVQAQQAIPGVQATTPFFSGIGGLSVPRVGPFIYFGPMGVMMTQSPPQTTADTGVSRRTEDSAAPSTVRTRQTGTPDPALPYAGQSAGGEGGMNRIRAALRVPPRRGHAHPTPRRRL